MADRLKIPHIILVLLGTFMAVICIVSFVGAVSWIKKPFPGFLLHKSMTLASTGQYHWTGIQAGINYPDKVIEINGKPVSSAQELKEVIDKSQIGDSITYTLKRGDQIIEKTVRTMRFTYADLITTFGSYFIASMAYILIGLVVYFIKPNIHVSRAFLMACFFLGLYSISVFDWVSNHMLTRIYMLSIAFVPGSLIHFSFYFPESQKFTKKYPKLQYVPYLISLMLGAPLALFYPDMRARIFYHLVLLYMVVGTPLLLYPILKSYFKPTSVITRQRAKVVLIGAVFAFPIPALAFFTQIVYGTFLGIRFQTNFLILPLLIFPASIAYAIARHNLFDVDVYIKRALGYVFMTAIIIGVYALISIPLNIALSEYEIARSRAFPILFTLVVILIFNPLYHRVQSFVDRVFFRKDYDYGAIIDKVGNAITSMIDLPAILKELVTTFTKDLFIDTSSVMLLTPEGSQFKVFMADGDDRQKVENVNIDRKAPVVEIIEQKKAELTKFDVLEDPKYQEISEGCTTDFEALNASLMVPLIYQERVIGLLSLGEKKSGKFYTREDINLLNAIAKQGAVAIKNAFMIQEIIEKERLKTKIMEAFGKYVTREVRDQIMEGRIPLDGESKEVTLLFADLRDFTTLAESTTPKEVVRIINNYFSEMAEAIGQHHGLVLQFIGDEIEAVFGAPLSIENHPTHAVRAALAMRERLILVNDNLQKQGYGLLKHGIGIHTGNVVAANIGSEDRLSYALVGDNVNIASRIQGLNKEFNTDILISGTTKARLDDEIWVEKLLTKTVKGKTKPVEIFKVI